MSDDQLIAEVARVWVDGGGDAEGLDWCHQKLKEVVNAEIENREWPIQCWNTRAKPDET